MVEYQCEEFSGQECKKFTVKLHTEGNLDSYSRSDLSVKIYGTLSYKGPQETAFTLAKLFPNKREHVRILDIAAGTGLCAEEFHKNGFRTMDALDPSKGMLEEARKKQLYKNLINVGIDDKTLVIADDTYDVLTMSGFSSHILLGLPIKALEEFIRITKPGGYVMITSHYTTFKRGEASSEDFRQKIRTLEERGRWEQVEMRHFPGYMDEIDGAVSVHRIC